MNNIQKSLAFLPVFALLLLGVFYITKYQMFRIPTSAMAPTISAGSLAVGKFTKDFKRNDIILYLKAETEDEEEKVFWVQRLVGLPGERIEIQKSVSLINGKSYDSEDKCWFTFKLEGSNMNMEKLKNREVVEVIPTKELQVHATKQEIKSLALSVNAENYEQLNLPRGFPQSEIYGGNEFNPWNIDYWGPAIIPAKGATVDITARNWSWLEPVINGYEGADLKIYILPDGNPDSVLARYTFKSSYYFTLGDNRHNSMDSRMSGFIQEEQIKGKIIRVF